MSRQTIIDSPLRPSPEQIAAAGTQPDRSPIPIAGRAEVLRRIRSERPDVVLLACTGPVVAAMTSAAVLRRRQRPVLLTGLPGISFPVRPRAIDARAGCDLLLLHSRRELAAFRQGVAERRSTLAVGLATLPFLAEASSVHRRESQTTLFAAQAEVPTDPATS